MVQLGILPRYERLKNHLNGWINGTHQHSKFSWEALDDQTQTDIREGLNIFTDAVNNKVQFDATTVTDHLDGVCRQLSQKGRAKAKELYEAKLASKLL